MMGASVREAAMSTPPPRHARAVVIGGGVVGCSVAYHLARLGWRDVLLLERRGLTCGTTWHAAGLIGQLRATVNLTRLARYSAGLYGRLEAETGQPTGFKQHGSLALARHRERMLELRRLASTARSFGLEVEVLTPAEAGALWPLMRVDDLEGAVLIPKDGQANPVDITLALAKGARMAGATILEGVEVTGIRTARGRVAGVDTEAGPVDCEVVVNCAGMWAREVGRLAGVSVPLHACEHFYVLTEPIEGVTPDLPVLRDPDGCAYFKEDAGKLLVGAFEPVAKPWGMDGIPDDFAFTELPEDWDHFMPILEDAMRRVPALEHIGIRKFFNGPESFTPDDRYHLGEAPELPGFFVAAGFNSIGIQSAGGAGWALAEWIADGRPPMDLWDVDIRRMQPFQNNGRYLRERAGEALGLLYAMHWPYRQYETARGVRTSPLHDRLRDLGACLGEAAGWERPGWFAPEGVEPAYRYSWERQSWFPYSREEHMAVREGVGLFDLSSFAKLLVQGRDAEAFLQGICSADIAVAPGRIVYTQWLGEQGGIEADVTVTRLDERAFLVVGAALGQVRDRVWLERHMGDLAVTVTDVTSGFAVIGLMGPRSRDLLQALTATDLSTATFPFATAREIELGHALVRAHRISYAGELGYELYVPSEMARGVLEVLLEAGLPAGMRLCGYHALDSLRLERGFRHWGHDIISDDSPLEAGLAVAWHTDFIGREALSRQREAPRAKRLVQLLLLDPEPLLFHDEPIHRDGELVGRLTSGAYGHMLGAAVGMGYVRAGTGIDPEWLAAGRFEIEVAGERVPARASLAPFHDPTGARMRV
jgi:glycine cleavage system aminomethyltransferase T/glycine/D-amino acid oxidase-like deaminating enzyme